MIAHTFPDFVPGFASGGINRLPFPELLGRLLEGKLGAPQVDFEVHTLESAGTGAVDTYRAASLAAVATGHSNPHRAVRDLYEPANADELIRRFLDFLGQRTAQIAP
jgi:hypothetical protein